MRPVVSLFGAMLCTALLIPPVAARAESANDVMPADHWSYAALNYLTEIGELEGFPEGYFDVTSEYRHEHGKTLTRYELAQGVARALDGLERGEYPAHVASLVNDLGVGFANQVHYGWAGSRWPADESYLKLATEYGWVVPPDHWAYNAVQYFIERGILAGPGYDSFEYPRSQMEFVTAIVDAEKAVNELDSENHDKDSLSIMVETLRAEFSYQAGEWPDSIEDLDSPKVPYGHWAYPAMKYVCSLGLLDRFYWYFLDVSPGGIRNRHTELTRKQFENAARAFARRLDIMDEHGADYLIHLRDLAEDLQAEFCTPESTAEESR